MLHNPHTFRRTFASILAKRGVDSLHIMRLGRWESIAMVERYTRSVRFEDEFEVNHPALSYFSLNSGLSGSVEYSSYITVTLSIMGPLYLSVSCNCFRLLVRSMASSSDITFCFTRLASDWFRVCIPSFCPNCSTLFN